MTEVQNDPDRVLHPLRRKPDGTFERVTWDEALDEIGERLGAIRRPPRRRLGRLVHGQPGRVLLLAPALGQGLPRRARLPALLHRLLPGRLQPLRRQLVPLRLAVHRPDPRPRADRLPARRRRQPARLARQRAQRAADQGPAARDHRARRARGRRRPAALGDRARVRARRDRPRRRRLDAALDARGDLRRGARGPRRDRAPVDRRSTALRAARRRAPARGDRGAAAGVAGRARSAQLARDLADAPSAPPSTGAPAPASAATAPWSRSCSTRSTWSPATSTARAGRCSATRRSTSAGSPSSLGARDLRQGPLAGRRPARGARLAAGLGDGEGDHDARARARSGRCSSPPATRCSRSPTATSSRPRSSELELSVAIDLYVTDTVAPLRLRAPGDDDVRARGLPASVPGPVHDARSSR